jgi:hypothetical protein
MCVSESEALLTELPVPELAAKRIDVETKREV